MEFRLSMNRTEAVSELGGAGMFSQIAGNVVGSQFTFTFVVPSSSGPMTIWDGVSGNLPLIGYDEMEWVYKHIHC